MSDTRIAISLESPWPGCPPKNPLGKCNAPSILWWNTLSFANYVLLCFLLKFLSKSLWPCQFVINLQPLPFSLFSRDDTAVLLFSSFPAAKLFILWSKLFMRSVPNLLKSFISPWTKRFLPLSFIIVHTTCCLSASEGSCCRLCLRWCAARAPPATRKADKHSRAQILSVVILVISQMLGDLETGDCLTFQDKVWLSSCHQSELICGVYSGRFLGEKLTFFSRPHP